MSKRKLTYKDFKNYFSNNLQNKDKHAFEKDMMQDAFEEEAFDGLSQLSKTELEADIAELKSTINSKSQRRRVIIPVWFKYAASVLILVGVGLSLVYLNSQRWQESMLKEQVSDEMEIADSMLFESEIKVPVTKQDTFKEPEVKDLVADNKSTKKEKKEVQKTESKVQEKELVPLADVEYDVDMEEELMVNDAIVESDKVEVTEILEMEEEVTSNEATEFVQAQPRVEVAKKSREKAEQNQKSKIDAMDTNIADNKQVIEIKGKVISLEDSLTVPGVSIVLKDDKKVGTTTNIDGEFSLSIPQSDDEFKTLIASFVGMETQEIDLTKDTSIIVYMNNSNLEMDAVVVTALGISRERKALGYSVQSVEETDFFEKSFNDLNKADYEAYILENLDYDNLKDYTGKYKIKLKFLKNENGTYSNLDIENSPNSVFTNEIFRVLDTIGKWEDNFTGKTTMIKFTLKIEIK